MKHESKFNLLKFPEEFNFKFHKKYDVSKIKEIVSDFDKEWGLEDTRQLGTQALMETSTYFLKKYDGTWKVGDPYNETKRYEDSKLWTFVDPIIKDLESMHGGRAGQVLIAKLPSKKIIAAHADPGDYLGVIRRNHIPLITHKDVIFSVHNEDVHMKEGECWEINNNKLHRVSNNSDVDRIHLTIDIIPEKYLV